MQKKIVYLDYLEHGNKIKNAGFGRWELKNGICTLFLQVKGLYTTDHVESEIFLTSRKQNVLVGKLILRAGIGSITMEWPEHALGNGEFSYEECNGILIYIGENRLLRSFWEVEEIEPEPVVQPAPMIEPEPVVQPVPMIEPEPVVQPIPVEEPTPVVEPAPAIHPIPVVESIPTLQQQSKSDEQPRVKKVVRDAIPAPDFSATSLQVYSDKWKQLTHTFASINPFSDARTYLSLTPKDFIILPSKYQTLVHNSFLLHGYYNYGHLILKKLAEERYYIGVPGVYLDREKQAAVLFGFEQFEGARETAATGEFGYYMYRVEL